MSTKPRCTTCGLMRCPGDGADWKMLALEDAVDIELFHHRAGHSKNKAEAEKLRTQVAEQDSMLTLARGRIIKLREQLEALHADRAALEATILELQQEKV